MNLPKQSNLVLRHDYYLGDFSDRSGNNNHGVPTGCFFQKKPDKHVMFSGTDLITVADAANLQLTEFTIICYGDFDKYTSTDRLVSKRDAGGTNYDLRFGNLTTLSLYDGSNTRSATINWEGAKSVAISCVSGSKAKGYTNGAFVLDFDDTSTITADDADLIIGNYYTGVNPQSNPLKGVLIYNTALTDEEIAQVHSWIMQTFTPSYPKRNFAYPSQIPQGKGTSYGAQLLTDGDMEAVGVGDWTVSNSATLTKETGARTGGGGVQILKIARGGVSNPGAEQTILSAGKKYRITGWVRSDGNATPRVRTSTTIYWVGTTSTDWQYFDVTSTIDNATIRIQSFDVAGTEYSEWDDVTVLEVQETVASYDMKNVHGKIIDKTGNGNDGTITGATQTKGLGGLDALKFKSGDKIALSNISLDDFNSVDWTVKVWVRKDAGGLQAFFGREAGLPRLYINTTEVSYDDLAVATFDAVTTGTWNRYVVTYDGTNITTYVDGVQSDQQPIAVETAFDSQTLYWGLAGAGTYDGALAEGEILFYAENQAEVTADYLKYAKLPTFVDDLKDANESVATNGGAIGEHLENTDWRFGDTSARYKVSRDDTLEIGAKVITNVTAGLLYQEMQQAYGTFEFDLYKKTDANVTLLGFIADVIGTPSATGQDGYFIRFSNTEAIQFTESTNGSSATKAKTADSYIAINTWYKIRITRQYDGEFTIYIKGGAFTDWTTVDVSGGSGSNPVTDNTTTESKYIVLDLDAGDKISGFKFYSGVLNPI